MVATHRRWLTRLISLLALAALGLAAVGGAAAAPTARTVRDAYGVPHIFAASRYDLFYAQGYAAAVDRLFQMETFRRASRGTLAELLGPALLPADEYARTEFYSDDERRAQLAALPAAQRLVFRAYTAGVNARIAEVLRSPDRLLPAEFRALGAEPAPWSELDSVAIAQGLVRAFGEAGGAAGHELDNALILADLTSRYGPDEARRVFDDLIWLSDPAAPTSVPGEVTLPLAFERRGPTPAAGTLREALKRLAEVRRLRSEVGFPLKLGSFAWAVAPGRTAAGAPLLVGGPQMGFTTPSIAHEVGLHGAGFDVSGIGFAGVPGIAIGASRGMAWSVTSGFGDQVDVYVEELCPTLGPIPTYRFKGACQPLEMRIEQVPVRDGDPVSLTIYRSVHGPVFAFDPVGGVMSQRRAHWGQELATWAALIEALQGRRLADFLVASGQLVSSQNLVYADQRGNVAYVHTGRPPIRAPGFDPRLPLPGTGEAEWLGYLPPGRLPRAVNPAQGYLANWNNKPQARWLNGDAARWGAVDRVSAIQAGLDARPAATADDMAALVREIAFRDYRADALKPHLLAAAADPDPAAQALAAEPRVALALQVLAAWPNLGQPGQVGETIFNQWRASTLALVFLDDVGAEALASVSGELNAEGDSLLLHAIRGPAASLPPSRDYFGGVSPSVALLQGLAAAMDELERRLGPYDPAAWGYQPELVTFAWSGIVLGRGPWSTRSTYTQIVELGPRLSGQSVLPPGESGFVGGAGLPRPSDHFADQLPLFAAWRYKPMWLALPEPAAAIPPSPSEADASGASPGRP